MNKGLFITLEGPDGSGKTTQIKFIEDYFRAKNLDVIISREPGGTEIGERLRDILLNYSDGNMADLTEALIFAAARAQHVAEKIRPAIEEGRILVCDRFVDSSIAYQGFGRELGDLVKTLNIIAIDGVMPDITFLLDLDPATGMKRIESGRGGTDRLEREKIDFHKRVRDGYMQLAAEYPARIKIIEAGRDPVDVRDDIFSSLDSICAMYEI